MQKLAMVAAMVAAAGAAMAEEPVELVDPMIGTVGTGHAFPGPCRPLGLAQLDYVLRSIENYGDLAAYKRAGRIRQWLSPLSSPRSCV